MDLGFSALFLADGYKIGHRRMLAPGTTRLYGTWIPRSLKHAPKGVDKIVSFGHQVTVTFLHEQFERNFFSQPIEVVDLFERDMEMYLGQPFDGDHFRELHKLGYLPVRVKALPEGIRTNPNIPHMTFVNTVDGFGWLTLYLETIISSLAWKAATSATIAYQYRKVAEEWVEKTDPSNMALVDFLCHDFSARGLSPWDMITSGLGHATSFRGSDTLPVIPAARYYYDEPTTETVINSVNASEHSVSTTKIFTVGEKQMIKDWLVEFPTGILSIVADTFDLWKLLVEYVSSPDVKALVMARDGKLVIRPDSGDPVDIICGKPLEYNTSKEEWDEFQEAWSRKRAVEIERDGYDDYYDGGDVLRVTKDDMKYHPLHKGVVELLWDIYGGTINEQGYKVLDSHIGAIYGDSINLDRQVQIYERLAAKGFAATNIVLGVGSYTYQMNTRDTLGFAAKGAWFEVEEEFWASPESLEPGIRTKSYAIYKDPITDDGTKKSLKGLQKVYIDEYDEYQVLSDTDWEEEAGGILQTIYEDGKFFNRTTLTQIRQRLNG